MSDEVILYSNFEIEESKKYMFELCGGTDLKIRNQLSNIIGQHFDKNIDLRKTLRGNFYDCIFQNTHFDDFDCSDYYFSSCEFKKTTAQNSNFKYLGIVDSNLNKVDAMNTSFDYAILDNVSLNDLNTHACNFQGVIIKNCTISNSNIVCSDFSGSIIKNSRIENISLLDTDIQYVEFEGNKIKNVSFLIEDILHCFNGIEMIRENQFTVMLRMLEDSREITGTNFIKSLNKMVPYFYSINDYFSLANISLFSGDSKNAYKYILLGLKYNLEQRDFKVIRYLCKLAASTPLFSTSELKSLYNFLESNAISSMLTRFEYRRYINELAEIKYMLFDNPNSQCQINITIKTSIDEYDYEKLLNIIETIDIVANYTIPQTPKSVSIRHNSPPLLDILTNGEWTNLVSFFTLLCAILGASSKYIKQIYDILILNEDLKNKKLENTLKEAENDIAQLEIALKNQQYEYNEIEKKMLIEKLEETHTNYKEISSATKIDGCETLSISYSIKSDDVNIPHEIRQMHIECNKK